MKRQSWLSIFQLRATFLKPRLKGSTVTTMKTTKTPKMMEITTKDHRFDFSVSWPIPALQPRGPTKRISMDLLLDVGLHWCRPSESILLFGVESRGALKCWSWLLFCNGSKTHVSEVFPRVFANGKVLHKTGEWGEVYSTEAISSFCVGLSHTYHQSSSSSSSS